MIDLTYIYLYTIIICFGYHIFGESDVNPLDPSRFSKKFPSSPDHSVKMGGNGFRMFFNFNIFSLHFLTLQVMFYGKIIELPTRW